MSANQTAGPYSDGTELARRVEAAISAGAASLIKSYDSGQWRDSPGYDSYEFGPSGRAALCAAALLRAGESPLNDAIAATLDFLADFESDNVRARSLRLSLFSLLVGSPARPDAEDIARRDLDWLLSQLSPDGAFACDSAARLRGDWDNFSTYIAHRSVIAAARAGLDVPDSFWRTVVRHWNTRRQADGGWSFDLVQAKSYGSVSAGAIASLIAAYSHLDSGEIVTGPEASLEFRDAGLKWLARNFSSWQNPGRGPQYYYRWAMMLCEAGFESGYATLGGHDWRSEITERLLATQKLDSGCGGWSGCGGCGGWGELADTAMALVYLCEMRVPVLFGKLRYTGGWNSRRFDVSGLSARLATRFERRLRWRLVDIDSSLSQWRDVQVLVISGSSAPKFSDRQLERLRQYAYRGGMILSIAAGDSPAFNVAMRRIYSKLFQNAPLREIDAEHPVFNAYRRLKNPPRLLGVSNGVRMLAIHSPTDISSDWHIRRNVLASTNTRNTRNTRDTRNIRTSTESDGLYLAANTYLHLSDFGAFDSATDAIDVLSDRSLAAIADRTELPSARIVLLTPGGADFPEPFAMTRFAGLLAGQLGVRLELAGPVDPAQLRPEPHTLAIFSGVGEFELSKSARQALRDYVNAGGLLLVTAAGGDSDFDSCIRKQISGSLLADSATSPAVIDPGHAILKLTGLEIDSVGYRRAARTIYGEDHSVKLAAESIDGRAALVYSRDDILASLVGFRGHGLRAYDSDSAYRLLRNMLLHAANRKAPDSPLLKNQVQVQWNP